MKRFFCLVMTVLILLLFCSCEEITPVSPGASAPNHSASKTGFVRLDELDGYDYKGREFRIAVYQSDSVFPQGAETTLDRALTKRNEAVEKKYNIKLKNAGISRETFFSDLRDAYDAGEDVCDIVVAPRSMISSLDAGDMLLNVNSLPYTNYEKTYFDSAAMDAASMGGYTYQIAGDFVYSPGSYWAVCYNQSLMDWFGFDDFVKLARNDQWTWELFNKYINMFYKDTNYDRVMTEVDRFGLACAADDEMLYEILWASSGIPFFENNPPSAMQIDFDSEQTRMMMEAMRKTIETPGRYSPENGGKSALQLFLDGQSLFYICPASTVGYLQLQGMNVGMLPLPKLNAEQEHFYGYVDPSAPVVYVLNNCRDTEFVGRVVQGLFAASDSIIYDNTVQVYGAYHLTGNAAVNFFIDMIKNGYYDPSVTLGRTHPEISAASFNIIRDVIELDGDFDALYAVQLTAFNETFASESMQSSEDGES